jgi:Spy/CpxP family protein refolding chaperone
MAKEKKESNTWLKMGVALLLILCGAAYTTRTWWTYAKGIPQPKQQNQDDFGEERLGPRPGGDRGNRGRGQGGPGNMSPEERQQRFNQMAEELHMTPEQKDQITKIWEAGAPQDGEGWRERFDKMRSVLTPEQQQQMGAGRESRRQDFMNKRIERAKKYLPPDQAKMYAQKLQERMNQMGNRGRGRGGPGGGPGGGRGGR